MRESLALTSDDVIALIRDGGFQAALHEHAPVFTVEEMMSTCGDIAGAHTKNLFLRDGKKTHYLVTLPHDARLDLKALRPVLGARGGLSFGSAEALADRLGVAPGSVSPLAILNDTERGVRVFIERSLLDADRINVHPLTNARTVSLRPNDLIALLRAHGFAAERFDLPATPPAETVAA